MFYPAPPDQRASNTGNSGTPSTGTTAPTAQANESWVGSIAFTNSGPTFAVTNSFTIVTNAQSGNSTAANNAKVYALEYTNNATAGATANSGGTLSAAWPLVGRDCDLLREAGPDARRVRGNYTLTGLSGTVTIGAIPVTAATVAYSKTYDGTTAAGGTPTFTAAPVDRRYREPGLCVQGRAGRDAGRLDQ